MYIMNKSLPEKLTDHRLDLKVNTSINYSIHNGDRYRTLKSEDIGIFDNRGELSKAAIGEINFEVIGTASIDIHQRIRKPGGTPTVGSKARHQETHLLQTQQRFKMLSKTVDLWVLPGWVLMTTQC